MKNVEQLNLRPVEGGVALPVKAVPGASRSRVVGVLGDCLKVAVSAPPEKGKANAAIAEILAESLGVGRRNVALLSGPSNPRKEFLVIGLTVEEIRARLGKD